MEELTKYFPELTVLQKEQFEKLYGLYLEWNTKINVISRKDMDAFYERHVLHSLGIAKVISFQPNTHILDVGTGGGFPGIPLAILFPEVQFELIDSIGKKVKVVQEVSHALGLQNSSAQQLRAEAFTGKVDFVVSRAVTRMESFVPWVQKKIKQESKHSLQNGILYLKGGDLTEELKSFPAAEHYELKRFFKSPFFETKKVVHLPL
ncbi:MAG: 16S rRNA (guanine(527)-N(7))-methyltransferase RsmG [Flavobacteriaceae bacterium]|nr:16S rRNA (guanine(527)-N(7))-methyltransferase RsmG [Flavobacteriaceae bacterium]